MLCVYLNQDKQFFCISLLFSPYISFGIWKFSGFQVHFNFKIAVQENMNKIFCGHNYKPLSSLCVCTVFALADVDVWKVIGIVHNAWYSVVSHSRHLWFYNEFHVCCCTAFKALCSCRVHLPYAPIFNCLGWFLQLFHCASTTILLSVCILCLMKLKDTELLPLCTW